MTILLVNNSPFIQGVLGAILARFLLYENHVFYCRGLTCPCKRQALKRLVEISSTGIVFLQETLSNGRATVMLTACIWRRIFEPYWSRTKTSWWIPLFAYRNFSFSFDFRCRLTSQGHGFLSCSENARSLIFNALPTAVHGCTYCTGL